MIKKQSLSDSLITSNINTYYGIDVATLTFLALGADMHASVYKAQAHDQRSYFVKLKRGHHRDISVMIVELLHKAGIQEIVPPIKTIRGHSTKAIEDATLIVYPFVEGEDGFSRNLSDNQWIKLGKALRRIHEMELPPAIQNRVRREEYSPRWRQIVRSLYSTTELVDDEVALKLGKFIKQNKQIIHRLLDRAEQLAHKVQEQSPPFVLCHSDIHGGNVLIDGNDTIYIVDWDDPIMAPKERDLMFIGAGVALVWNKPREEALFYKGYGETEVNSTLLAYYRHERIVEDIALYSQALLLNGDGGDSRPEMYKQFVDMFKPQGVVEMAFKTDEAIDV